MFDFTNANGNTDYSPYLTLFGGGMSAASGLMASNTSANLMRANAGIAGQQFQSTQQAGAEEAEMMHQRTAQTIGRQEAQVGGSGLTLSGSPLRSIENTAYFGAQDIARVQTNAARRAWGFQTQQVGDQFRASQDQAAGTFNAMGSLITSGARAYGQWSNING
jgi:hypothetical protein